MLRIEGCQWRCQGKFKPSMVISLLSLLFPLTFGKGILMSSLAPFKGFGFRNPANFGIRNPDFSTACNPKSKNVLHTLTLLPITSSTFLLCWASRSSSWTQIMHAMSKLRRRNLPGPRLSLISMLWLRYLKGYIICWVIIKGFLIHEQVKTNADKIKLRAKIVNLSYKNKEPRYGYLRKSISSLVLDQIVSFSCEIVAHQELFWVAFSATSELSATKTTMETRKYKKSNRLISTVKHWTCSTLFGRRLCSYCTTNADLSNLIEMAMRSSL